MSPVETGAAGAEGPATEDPATEDPATEDPATEDPVAGETPPDSTAGAVEAPIGPEEDGVVPGEPVPGEPVPGEPVPGAEVEALVAERDEYLDTLRRLQAEFDNFRKRTARQQAETFDRAVEAVVERLLPALDALDLALAHVGGSGGSELESAFVRIGTLLRDILAKEGLERIDADGVAFDPTVHDAVAHVSADDESAVAGGPGGGESAPEPAVVETLRAGYRLKGRVLRPAMVKVRA
ncbi:MAG: nucleotide exchange factor GrpE [Acidimicrobiales bacterium]